MPVREYVSPWLTRRFAQKGFGNRDLLASNLKNLGIEDKKEQAALIDQLARVSILKSRFGGKQEFKNIHHFMFSCLVTPAKIDALNTTDEIKAKLKEGAFQPGNNSGYKQISASIDRAFSLGRAATRAIKKVLWPGAFGLFLFGDVGLYLLIRDHYYPKYHFDKDIQISSEGPRLLCHGKDCRTDEIFSFQGSQAADQARQAAEKLQKVINNGDLFEGAISPDKTELIVTDSWIPGWVPFSSTTIFDLASESLSPDDLADRFITFYDGLKASGILPSPKELIGVKVAALEAQEPFARFRDQRLDHHYHLAGLYLQQKRYAEAIATAQEIINHDLTVTGARSLHYHDAIFLLADIERSLAMRFWDPAHIYEALDRLEFGKKGLKSMEDGFHARTAQDQLMTCSLGKQLFPRRDFGEACRPETVPQYLKQATFQYNRYTPTFNDNFIAVRSLREYAKYQVARKEYQEADAAYQRLLILLDLIDDCRVVVGGDTERQWTNYQDYLAPADRLIGKFFGKADGLESFAARCVIARTQRGDAQSLNPLEQFAPRAREGWPRLYGAADAIGQIYSSDQFDPKYFKVFRAQTYQGLALIELKLAGREYGDQDRTRRLRAAIDYLERAFFTAKQMQRTGMPEFFFSRFEEKQTYYDVLIDLARALYKLYCLNEKDFPEHLARAQALAAEVARQKYDPDEPLDLAYLKAISLQGQIAVREADGKKDLPARRDGYEKALSFYRIVLANIAAGEAAMPDNQQTPPLYRGLKEKAEIEQRVLLRRITGISSEK